MSRNRKRVAFLVNEGKAFRPWADPVRDLTGHFIYRCTPTRPPRRAVDAIVNVGCSTTPEWLVDGTPMLNSPRQVGVSSSKVRTFRWFDRYGIPTVPHSEAGPTDNGLWVARTIDRGMQGRGIVIFDGDDPVPEAELYTKLTRRRGLREFGILYGPNGVVYRTTLKRKRSGREYTREEELIRSHNNGWAVTGAMPQGWTVYHDQLLQDIAMRCSRILPWGRADLLVDTLVPADEAEVFVLELNSRPGVDDSRSKEAFANLVDDWLRAGTYVHRRVA